MTKIKYFKIIMMIKINNFKNINFKIITKAIAKGLYSLLKNELFVFYYSIKPNIRLLEFIKDEKYKWSRLKFDNGDVFTAYDHIDSIFFGYRKYHLKDFLMSFYDKRIRYNFWEGLPYQDMTHGINKAVDKKTKQELLELLSNAKHKYTKQEYIEFKKQFTYHL